MSGRMRLLAMTFVVGLLIPGCSGVDLASIFGDATGTGAGVTLSGTLSPGQSAKTRPTMQAQTYPYTVVAQSNETGEIYRAQAESDGGFTLDLPAEETGNGFMVTILGPDGRAVGPVVFGQSGDDGVAGVTMSRDASLGTMTLPADPTADPIEPGTGATTSGLADSNVTIELSTTGAPAGLATYGKGANVGVAVGGDDGRRADADKDGLIDVFDADDDGDGVVDDFDGDGSAGGELENARAAFFMNLKISPEEAPTYYSGTAAEVAARLAVDTVITFEVMTEPSSTLAITGASLLETPGPAYLPTSSKVADSPSGLTYTPWVDTSYAFDAQTDRYDAFCRPNDVMSAGDTFTVDVTFDDGSTAQYTRMINFVFKNIPKLIEYGTAAAMTAFDVTSTTINGTQAAPIPFDGTQDLVLTFEPPPDELGNPLTGMYYTFQVFYESASGTQYNNDIDWSASFPTAIADFDRGTYYVSVAALGALSASGTYTVTLPKDIFADQVTLTTTGTTVPVGYYKIDITAECPSGNAAIMLTFDKQ